MVGAIIYNSPNANLETDPLKWVMNLEVELPTQTEIKPKRLQFRSIFFFLFLGFFDLPLHPYFVVICVLDIEINY